MKDQPAERHKTANALSKRTEVLRSGRGLAGLTFIWSALKVYNAGKNNADGEGPNQGSHACRKITHEHGCAAADRAQ
jgi:hypothetical protein